MYFNVDKQNEKKYGRTKKNQLSACINEIYQIEKAFRTEILTYIFNRTEPKNRRSNRGGP